MIPNKLDQKELINVYQSISSTEDVLKDEIENRTKQLQRTLISPAKKYRVRTARKSKLKTESRGDFLK